MEQSDLVYGRLAAMVLLLALYLVSKEYMFGAGTILAGMMTLRAVYRQGPDEAGMDDEEDDWDE